MTIRNLITAASALALLAGAAHAQTMAPANPPAATDTTMPAEPATGEVATSGAAMVDRSTTSAMTPATSSDASAVVTTTTVTNGPVADTPENRKKYGGPMSNAGKRTGAKGN